MPGVSHELPPSWLGPVCLLGEHSLRGSDTLSQTISNHLHTGNSEGLRALPLIHSDL